MVISCEQVWQEVSNYLDGEVAPDLRAAIDDHIRGCQRCAAVVNGTRNVVQLYSDERMLEMPVGLSQRLRRRIENDAMPARRSFLGWMVAAAAVALVGAGLEMSRSPVSRIPDLRFEHAWAGKGVPPDMLVVISKDGKLFHRAGCDLIRDKQKLEVMPSWKAEKEGYTPCPRCLRKYLTS